MTIAKTIGLFSVLILVILETLPSNVLADDWKVHAVSPGFEVVVGKDVTFKWKKTATRRQRSFRLRTSAGTVEINGSQQEYIWRNFPYGSGWWEVSVFNWKNQRAVSWIGMTSRQSFYHFNNETGYQYSDFSEFDYKEGPRGKNKQYGLIDTVIYYEVMRDYSVDLTERFADENRDKFPPALEAYSTLGELIDLLPGWAIALIEAFGIDIPDLGSQPLGWKKTDAEIQALQDHIEWLKSKGPIIWDFIELVDGVLTVKKGYRWDGASTFGNDCNLVDNKDYLIRGSCLHDSLYDLMRMGYLEHDDLNNHDSTDDEGGLNRLMADILMYMIMEEDKHNHDCDLEFYMVRYGGARNTKEDATNMCNFPLLAEWKYHASELTAWASEDNVELRFRPADDQLKDPNGYGAQTNTYHLYRSTRNASFWQLIASFQEPSPLTIAHTDTAVVDGEIYYYQIKSVADEEDINWFYRRYDESNIEAVAAPEGAGNALVLDGSNDYVEANLVSNDLYGGAITFEGWVYPDIQDGGATIFSYTTIEGDYLGHLLFTQQPGMESDNRYFSYYDDILGESVFSAASFPPENWYHVAVVINELNEGTLFVNGNQQATFNTASRPTRVAAFSIGRQDVGDGHFRGLVDEVRIWNAALVQDEIRAGMCTPMRGDEPALVGLWHFDEPYYARKAYGATFNGNDGMLSGYDLSETAFIPSDAMNMPIFASFMADNTYGTAPHTVTFSDTSIGDIAEWIWDFGDGHTSDERNPQHTYTVAGRYDVSLTASGSDANNTIVKTAYITITEPDSDDDSGGGSDDGGGGGGGGSGGGGCFIDSMK